MNPSPAVSRAAGWSLAAVWGVGGTVALLVDAVVRLLPKALGPLQGDVGVGLVVAYGGAILLLGYTEGYRGFQLKFAPQVVARARGLRGPVQGLLAPLFCLGLLGGTAGSRLRSWALLAMIVGFVIAVSFLPPVWRGAVDAGVVVGLTWGTLAILKECFSASSAPAR